MGLSPLVVVAPGLEGIRRDLRDGAFRRGHIELQPAPNTRRQVVDENEDVLSGSRVGGDDASGRDVLHLHVDPVA